MGMAGAILFLKGAMRFTRQHDSYSCGPIMLINLLKALGEQASSKKYSCLWELCWCTPPRGTRLKYIKSILQYLGLPFTYYSNLKYYKAKKHLRRGLILGIRFNHPSGGHYALLVPGTAKYCWGINLGKGKTIKRLSFSDLQLLIQESKDCYNRPANGFLIDE